MAELVQRHVQQQERSAQIAAKIAAGMTKSTVAPIARPGMKAVPSLAAPTQTTRRFKRTSNAMLGGDKENDNGSSDPMEYPKKRARAVPANASETGPVLSPTSFTRRIACQDIACQSSFQHGGKSKDYTRCHDPQGHHGFSYEHSQLYRIYYSIIAN
ncbi:hypothetical protein CFO_g3721 [Ceratocystis platani]|uniref:Uncharacterized protein n=1 Tax=Ceratocystis fimbriata f. sp. platani TaxID=88771 RepID=A0A0F8BN30_CERFI|nr:hypothetical protein CFO_g3721 [Ceratocystis platani]